MINLQSQIKSFYIDLFGIVKKKYFETFLKIIAYVIVSVLLVVPSIFLVGYAVFTMGIISVNGEELVFNDIKNINASLTGILTILIALAYNLLLGAYSQIIFISWLFGERDLKNSFKIATFDKYKGSLYIMSVLLISMLGALFAFILPVIYIAMIATLASFVYILEDVAPRTAIRKSAYLFHKNWKFIFLITILTEIVLGVLEKITFGISSIVLIPFTMWYSYLIYKKSLSMTNIDDGSIDGADKWIKIFSYIGVMALALLLVATIINIK